MNKKEKASKHFRPMATPLTLKRVFESICISSGIAGSWRSRRAPRGRRMIRKDAADQQQGDEFQHAAARCLSSYYSVFVARLAIMVSLNFVFGFLMIVLQSFICMDASHLPQLAKLKQMFWF